MLRRPDTPVLPKTASRLAAFATAVASLGLLFSMPETDTSGRDHVFTPLVRASHNALSLGMMTLELKAIDSVIARKRKEQAKEE